MDREEFLKSIHTLSEPELFYKKYQEAKSDSGSFPDYIERIDRDECIAKHYIIPEIRETMPPSMLEEYFIAPRDSGMVIQKHHCYTPEFSHFHTYFECIYVYEGNCIHSFYGQKKTLTEGDFSIVPPGVSHSLSVMDESIVFNLIISNGILANVFKNSTYYKENVLSGFFISNLSYKTSPSILSFHTGKNREIRELILMMAAESQNKLPECDGILIGSFSILFGLLVRHFGDKYDFFGKNTEKEEKMGKILIYIKENQANITLSSLAEKFGYTKEYLSKLIKENTGKSFKGILIESRMKHAIMLLESTELSIENIAYQLGYQNQENFIRTFRKCYGIPPAQYRKNLRKPRK